MSEKNAYERIDSAMRALRALSMLFAGSASSMKTGLALVDPDDLGFLTGLIVAELEAALADQGASLFRKTA